MPRRSRRKKYRIRQRTGRGSGLQIADNTDSDDQDNEDMGYASQEVPSLFDTSEDTSQVATPQEVETQPLSPQEVGPQEVGPQEVGPQEVGPQEVGPQEVGPQEVGPQDVGPQEVGLQEVGPQGVGSQQVVPHDWASTGAIPRPRRRVIKRRPVQNRSGPGARLICTVCGEGDHPDDPVTKTCKCSAAVESAVCCYHYRCLVQQLITSVDANCPYCDTQHTDAYIYRPPVNRERQRQLHPHFDYELWNYIHAYIIGFLYFVYCAGLFQFLEYTFGKQYDLHLAVFCTFTYWLGFKFYREMYHDPLEGTRERILFYNLDNPSEPYVFEVGAARRRRRDSYVDSGEDADVPYEPIPAFAKGPAQAIAAPVSSQIDPDEDIEFEPPTVPYVPQPPPPQNPLDLSIVDNYPQGAGGGQSPQPHNPLDLSIVDNYSQGEGEGKINPNFDQIFDEQFAPYLHDDENGDQN